MLSPMTGNAVVDSVEGGKTSCRCCWNLRVKTKDGSIYTDDLEVAVCIGSEKGVKIR